jgi:peptidyl-tRNA hydrolase
MTNQDDPITMYLVFREKLLPDVSIGKVAAQVSHATGMLHQQYAKLDKRYDKLDPVDFGKVNFPVARYFLFTDWLKEGIRKVVLKADEKEFAKLKEEQKDQMVLVIDAGETMLEPGTETCVGLFPMRKSQRSKLLTRLQVL